VETEIGFVKKQTTINMKEPLTFLSKWHNQITYWKMKNYYITDSAFHAGGVYSINYIYHHAFEITIINRQPVHNQNLIMRFMGLWFDFVEI
jgi:hypothetical protein